jgi:hypothetical protein
MLLKLDDIPLIEKKTFIRLLSESVIPSSSKKKLETGFDVNILFKMRFYQVIVRTSPITDDLSAFWGFPDTGRGDLLIAATVPVKKYKTLDHTSGVVFIPHSITLCSEGKENSYRCSMTQYGKTWGVRYV